MVQNISSYSEFKNSVLEREFSQRPLNYMDIGARGGEDQFVSALHDFVHFLGFEPDQAECQALNANQALKEFWRGFTVLPYALSNIKGEQILNIISAETNTSLLQPDVRFVKRYNMQAKWSVVKQIKLPVVPLDVLREEHNFSSNLGEIIKVDTQGTEYQILQGAEKLLRDQTMCVISEVEFFPIYKEQKLFSDVEQFLRTCGFSFYGFLTTHTRSKKLLNKALSIGKERLFYADAIFFKDPLEHDFAVTQRQMLVLIAAGILTGFYDFALELLASDLLQIEQTDKTQLVRLIQTLSCRDPNITQNDLQKLVEQIAQDGKRANVYLGKFVDQLNFPNFEDIGL